jgi:polyhydroxyalkanoate synthesis regulator phasin
MSRLLARLFALRRAEKKCIIMPRSIVTCATYAGPYPINEDFCGWKDLGKARILVVADGVSGSPKGEIASWVAVKAFLEKIEEAAEKAEGKIDRQIIQVAYKEACAAIKEQAQTLTAATTFISVVELEDRFLISYIGDGAIVLTTGSLKYATNLLIPHLGYAGALTRTLNAQVEEPKPAYIEIEKGFEDGEVVLIGTDGALPRGQVLETARKVLEKLRKTCQEEREYFDEKSARKVLEEMVTNVIDFDDNRTLGLVLTEEAISYWLQHKSKE